MVVYDCIHRCGHVGVPLYIIGYDRTLQYTIEQNQVCSSPSEPTQTSPANVPVSVVTTLLQASQLNRRTLIEYLSEDFPPEPGVRQELFSAAHSTSRRSSSRHRLSTESLPPGACGKTCGSLRPANAAAEAALHPLTRCSESSSSRVPPFLWSALFADTGT